MIRHSIPRLLEALLERGGFVIGEIQVTADIELRHRSEADQTELTESTSPEAARHLAVYDSAGKYRPLKTAPNLRRGWRLRLGSIRDLRLALDYFYPAAIGAWLAFLRDDLAPIHLRTTLARQTGMYRIVQTLTDEQAETLIAATCPPEATLSLPLWGITADQPHAFTRSPEQVRAQTPANEIPLLSAEANNLIVAEGRKLVKSAPKN